MNFIDRITGNDINRTLKQLENRIKVLPISYQTCYKEVSSQLWLHSNMTGRNMIPFFESCVEIFEEMALDCPNCMEMIKSVDEFVQNLIKGSENDYRQKWRNQLNQVVRNKINKE